MLARTTLLSCFAALSAITLAQDDTSDSDPLENNIFMKVDTPFTFTDCAAPKEMEACWSANPIPLHDDTCPKVEARVQCALTNCWNRVYSCDYQQLSMAYNTTCGISPDSDPGSGLDLNLPFFPAPDEAQAACSCNLGQLAASVTTQSLAFLKCIEDTQTKREKDNPDADPDSFDGNYPECGCCFYGSLAETISDSCPDTNPSPLGLDYVREGYLTNFNTSLDSCASRLSNFSCASYDFNDKAKDMAKQPTTTATGTLTDLPGIITSPVSGATYTWTAQSTTYTITAASVEAMATRQATATSSGKGHKSTGATGAAGKLSGGQHSVVALAGFAGLAVALL